MTPNSDYTIVNGTLGQPACLMTITRAVASGELPSDALQQFVIGLPNSHPRADRLPDLPSDQRSVELRCHFASGCANEATVTQAAGRIALGKTSNPGGCFVRGLLAALSLDPETPTG